MKPGKVHAYYKPWCRWAWLKIAIDPKLKTSRVFAEITCKHCLALIAKEVY